MITGVFVTTAMETTAADKDLMVMKQLQRKNVQVDDLKLGCAQSTLVDACCAWLTVHGKLLC